MYDNETDANEPSLQTASKRSGATSVKQVVLDQVGVTVEAFIGNSELTIGQVNELKPGSVIELDAHLQRDVEIRLDGMCIGRGELVSVGDKFAVKLIELGQQ